MAERKKPESVNLTDTRVLKARTTGKLYRIWDSVVPGFHLLVTPAGGRSFRVQFQRPNGSKVSVTIGNAEVWTLDAAREKARVLRQMHEDGKDARSHVKEQRNAKDLKALVELWRTDYKPLLKPTSQASYESLLKTLILPRLGGRLVRDLGFEQVKELHRKESKDHEVNANRAVAVLSRLLSIAEKEGWRDPGNNPCRQLEKPMEKRRERKLDPGEYVAFHKALEALVKEKKLPGECADLVRFLALSGLRKSEVLNLRFADVDLERNCMKFEDHKTAKASGTKTLPLNSHLREIIKRRSGERLSGLVFPGFVSDGVRPIQGLSKMWARIAEKAKLENVTPHDLRRTFASTCAELGFGAAVADSLLGHSLGRITDVYVNFGADGILAQGSQATADWIAAAMAGKAVKPGVRITKGKTKDQTA